MANLGSLASMMFEIEENEDSLSESEFLKIGVSGRWF